MIECLTAFQSALPHKGYPPYANKFQVLWGKVKCLEQILLSSLGVKRQHPRLLHSISSCFFFQIGKIKYKHMNFKKLSIP